jgi:hypothetical protein
MGINKRIVIHFLEKSYHSSITGSLSEHESGELSVLLYTQISTYSLFFSTLLPNRKRGCRTKQLVRSSFLVQKITARPQKNLAVGVKLMYDQTH